MDDQSNIRELLQYINKIKAFEQRGFRNYSAISAIVWGFLLAYAGIMDYFAYQLDNTLFHFLPWLLSSIGGFVITLVMRKGVQKVFDTPDEDSVVKGHRKASAITAFTILVVWVGVVVLIAQRLSFLINPFVALCFGSMMLYFVSKQPRSQPKKFKVAQTIPPALLLFTALVEIMLYLLVGDKYVDFYGMAIGLSFGLGMIGVGMYILNHFDPIPSSSSKII